MFQEKKKDAAASKIYRWNETCFTKEETYEDQREKSIQYPDQFNGNVYNDSMRGQGGCGKDEGRESKNQGLFRRW